MLATDFLRMDGSMAYGNAVRSGRSLCVLIALAMQCSGMAWAGPPFQTDDPDPVPLHHYEAYSFASADGSGVATATLGPAAEFNWGVLPNTQLHIIIPVAGYFQPSGPDTAGLGDIETGVKYRFLKESKWRPEVGIFPFIELPTGSLRRNLGNGQAWARLPLWLQKSFGPWTTYGGGGEVINNAPGMRDYPFAGWLVQRELNSKLTLGMEAYGHGAEGQLSPVPNAATLLDLGGFYNFRDGFSLLFCGGHSVVGEAETYAYLGLYWTWGPKGSGGAGESAQTNLFSTMRHAVRSDAGFR
jgi:hypothetical protein